ncbi:MAG TPA: (Fe-S)-binding protein [Burkholderiales bacterium]|nr:(Fe-S)-binding protein [Burkholderiales bacterium]
MKPDDLPQRARELADLADRCVACGLCLPHCPTYLKTLSEADSPRGRIQLMKGVLEARIPLNARFIEHIDLCLTCRACENVCPNNVAYGELVDGTRVIIEAQRPRSKLHQWLRGFAMSELAAKPWRLEKLASLLRFYRQSGLQRLARGLGILRVLGLNEMEQHLPPVARHPGWNEIYPASGEVRGEVGLFLGCVARVADAATLNAAIFVLNRLGYMVHVPRSQTCCGALYQHSGDLEAAKQLARENLRAFAAPNLGAVISTASGCGATLAEYKRILGDEARAFSARITDLSSFLSQDGQMHKIDILQLNAKIAVQDPCTLRNVMRSEKSPYALLKLIPQAEVVALTGNDQCCGAAGTYFLSQPEMAGTLRDDKIRALQQSGASWLATSNVGCAMHLAEGVRAAGLAVKIVHPVTLLARQMGFECNDA